MTRVSVFVSELIVLCQVLGEAPDIATIENALWFTSPTLPMLSSWYCNAPELAAISPPTPETS